MTEKIIQRIIELFPKHQGRPPKTKKETSVDKTKLDPRFFQALEARDLLLRKSIKKSS